MASEFEHMQHDTKVAKRSLPNEGMVTIAASVLVSGGVDAAMAVREAWRIAELVRMKSEEKVKEYVDANARRRKGY